MTRYDALSFLMGRLKDDDLALFTTGMISREAQAIGDRERNLYVLGAMGLVSAVGLGLAWHTSKRVFVFDGEFFQEP